MSSQMLAAYEKLKKAFKEQTYNMNKEEKGLLCLRSDWQTRPQSFALHTAALSAASLLLAFISSIGHWVAIWI